METDYEVCDPVALNGRISKPCSRVVVAVIKYGVGGIPVCKEHLAARMIWAMDGHATVQVYPPASWAYLVETRQIDGAL
jgi:hypothetical protein